MDNALDTVHLPTTGWRFELLNGFQRDFPLSPKPFKQIAEQLGVDQHTVLTTLAQWQTQGVLSRIGTVFRPNTIGRSTLAALAVPPERLAAVAAQVSNFSQVNHNYEREHPYNLWFVVVAADEQELVATLEQIRLQTGLPLLSLPLVRDYHIDLGFDLRHGMAPRQSVPSVRIDPTPAQRQLLAELDKGFPLVASPYRQLADAIGQTQTAVIDQLDEWLHIGVIRRIGLILRHRELGYTANAMAVWDVPDTLTDDVGEHLAEQRGVTLCYRRHRQSPDWPFNLFCMVHGQDRERVSSLVADLGQRLGLDTCPHAVLFSRQRFKQRGARYG